MTKCGLDEDGDGDSDNDQNNLALQNEFVALTPFRDLYRTSDIVRCALDFGS